MPLDKAEVSTVIVDASGVHTLTGQRERLGLELEKRRG